jgi:hypothetical protein
VTILDRNFLSAKLLLGLQMAGLNRHWLVRSNKRQTWKVTRSLGRWDKIVELNVRPALREDNPKLPPVLKARAISYRHPTSKERQWLLTSIVDDTTPAGELVALYRERWEIEISYDELKTHMLENQETLRSKTASGVRQEFWGILLTYNLVRLEMSAAALEAKLPALRISFVMTLRYLRTELYWCAIASPGALPKRLKRIRQDLLGFILPPRRSERSYPRAVKVKGTNYPRKHREKSN